MNAPTYNFGYLDEQTKRMIRRAILKAIAILTAWAVGTFVVALVLFPQQIRDFVRGDR